MDFDEIKEEVRERLDLAEVIGQYVRLERAGSRLKGLCPFHQENTPSFYVDPERGFWHCFGCGAGGDLFSFVMQREGLSFPEALRMLARRAGVHYEDDPQAAERRKRREQLERANEIAREHFTRTLFEHSAAESARTYLRERGFNKWAVTTFELGFALDSWDHLLTVLGREGINPTLAQEAGLAKAGDRGGHYDTFRDRIVFPIKDLSGRTIGFGGRAMDPENPAKYLNSPETPLFEKRRTLYALNLARDAIGAQDLALIVEGYTDVISLHQRGLRNVVAGLGTALTAQQLDLLGRYADEVVLVYDADVAGERAALRNLEVFEGSDVAVSLITLPDEMDPDEFVSAHGPEAFEELLEGRVSPIEYRLRSIFAEHADRGPEGASRAAREAVDVLLRVDDWTRRDEFVSRAADMWGRGDPGRTESMARVLKMELSRQVRGGRRRPSGEGDSSIITRTLTSAPSGLLRAETEVLARAFDDPEVAALVAANLEAEDMLTEADAIILHALQEHVEEDALHVESLIDSLPDEGGVRERAVELTVAQVARLDVEDDDTWREVVEQAIRRLRMRRRAGGAGSVTMPPGCDADDEIPVEDFGELERRVYEGINSGELAPDDPLVQQYREVCRRLRGAGERGFVGDEPDGADEEAKASGETQQPDRPRPSDASSRPADADRESEQNTATEDRWAVEEGDPFDDE